MSLHLSLLLGAWRGEAAPCASAVTAPGRSASPWAWTRSRGARCSVRSPSTAAPRTRSSVARSWRPSGRNDAPSAGPPRSSPLANCSSAGSVHTTTGGRRRGSGHAPTSRPCVRTHWRCAGFRRSSPSTCGRPWRHGARRAPRWPWSRGASACCARPSVGRTSSASLTSIRSRACAVPHARERISPQSRGDPAST